MRILVVGAGGVGGYFGGRLAEAGRDVTFLVRPRRKAMLAEHGLRIASPYGDARLQVQACTTDELRPVHDIALLACKAYDLPEAIASLAPGLAREGAVLPVLNGLAHLDALDSAFGRERVMGGLARIQATLDAQGTVRHLAEWNTIVFGDRGKAESARSRAFQEAFSGSRGVKTVLSPDIEQAMWDKFVHIATGTAMTCLMRANIGEILRTPDGPAIVRRTLETAIEVARREGHAPDEAHIAAESRIFGDPASGYMTSMSRDLERGNRSEGEHILGDMLTRVRRTGVEETIFALAATHVRAYEERRQAGRLPGTA